MTSFTTRLILNLPVSVFCDILASLPSSAFSESTDTDKKLHKKSPLTSNNKIKKVQKMEEQRLVAATQIKVGVAHIAKMQVTVDAVQTHQLIELINSKREMKKELLENCNNSARVMKQKIRAFNIKAIGRENGGSTTESSDSDGSSDSQSSLIENMMMIDGTIKKLKNQLATKEPKKRKKRKTPVEIDEGQQVI